MRVLRSSAVKWVTTEFSIIRSFRTVLVPSKLDKRGFSVLTTMKSERLTLQRCRERSEITSTLTGRKKKVITGVIKFHDWYCLMLTRGFSACSNASRGPQCTLLGMHAGWPQVTPRCCHSTMVGVRRVTHSRRRLDRPGQLGEANTIAKQSGDQECEQRPDHLCYTNLGRIRYGSGDQKVWAASSWSPVPPAGYHRVKKTE